jgi:uncharacterized FlaG/YvyC family protein
MTATMNDRIEQVKEVINTLLQISRVENEVCRVLSVKVDEAINANNINQAIAHLVELEAQQTNRDKRENQAYALQEQLSYIETHVRYEISEEEAAIQLEQLLAA